VNSPRLLSPSLVLLLVTGCGEASEEQAADGDYSDEMPEELPAGGCRGSTGSTGSTGDTGGLDDCDVATTTSESSTSSDAGSSADSECAGSADCQGEGACVAGWDGTVRGPYACRFACVPTLDESAWCRDDASCCDPDAVCTPRGYCVVDDRVAETSTGS